ncbi:Maf-like protein [Plasmodium gonderi]|uniref:Maf-like protein n=1 Tax=Plasmodium gonderi TaxID=77519 RepID=A0A1Y1JEP8_PLAGO|nr:Maf-like protein [Plasmodium gonderi]GAW80128.1 Maf-like protein [Plasmodium gonderi]
MNKPDVEECKLNHVSSNKKIGDLNNGVFLEKEKESNNKKLSINDLELEIDDDIISHLSSRICNKNVTHKIIKINNLIDDHMYEYITNCQDSDISESNDTNHMHEDSEKKHFNLHNGYRDAQIGSESLSTKFAYDNLEWKNNTPEQIPSHDLNKEIHSKSKTKGKNNSPNELTSDEHTNFEKIKMMNLIGGNRIVYNSKNEQNNVLYLCYDEINEQCDVCDRYKKNYMSNMYPSSCVHLKNINGVSEVSAPNLVGIPNGVYNISSTTNSLNDYFFVLGSTSNSRKYILKQSNLDFLSVRIHIDEKKIGCRKRHNPLTLTSNISVGKGLRLLNMIKKNNSLQKQISDLSKDKKVVLLVGDEVIYCNKEIYEKPKNEKEAYNFLKSYSNNKCYSYSSITLIELKTEKVITGIDESIINIYDMDDSVVKKILDDSSIYFCAGALKIENIHMHKYIKVIKGNIDSIFGLSLNLLFHLVNFL